MQTSIKLADVKANARGRLQGHYPQVIFITITYFFFVLFLESCAEVFNHDTTILAFSIGAIASFVITAINIKYKISVQNSFLKLASSKSSNSNIIFQDFVRDGGAKSKIALTITVLYQICFFPAEVVSFMYSPEKPYLLLALAVALLLGMVVYLILDIRLMAVYYLVNDVKDITATQALLTSFWLTKKNFFKILVLRLSFIPLYLLSFLSCGAGLLLVFPYAQTSEACMYLELCDIKESDSSTDSE